ncbi:hypothetical protein DSM104443_00159 [Usitatibacter rugosus]|uniref:Macro domain-containing protein n=1 Tax=Usitatibacter rugosus TaxID=2732067 RepID=A0A6M4GS23_9PROT|nr:macro domain-containing protein [Usitatibacter rugosus]QJR09123.1 hypothetical protein DSM104443_00159 [Usitatibacter rugosus]
MLTYVRGNLFDSPAQVLVNTVNTVGVMGKGIALTFKSVYPEMFTKYVALCESKQFDIGNLFLYKTQNKWILNFPTKKHWRNPSKLEYIERGLQKFVDTYSEQNIVSIAFPQLGCGNGELLWEDVEPVMQRYLRALPINVFVYLYQRGGEVEHRDLAGMRTWLRSEPAALPFDEFWSDIKDVVRTKPLFREVISEATFSASIVRYDQEGLLLYLKERTWAEEFRDSVRDFVNRKLRTWRLVSPRAVFVPEDSLLELWQAIRFNGFCYSQTMPVGLEELTPYVISLLRELPYFRSIQLSASDKSPAVELGLQLHVPAAKNSSSEVTVEMGAE